MGPTLRSANAKGAPFCVVGLWRIEEESINQGYSVLSGAMSKTIVQVRQLQFMHRMVLMHLLDEKTAIGLTQEASSP
jgi:hypothetical protein